LVVGSLLLSTGHSATAQQDEAKPKPPPTRAPSANLEEAELPELVRLISNMTGRRFILPTKLRAIKATVFAPTKVTVAEAYHAFLSVLEVNGLTVVPAGRYLKSVEVSPVLSAKSRCSSTQSRSVSS
jgi:general secretion pathway protein D